MTTVVVSGALANRPLNGGGAWVRISWIRGLQRLGFDVVFVEQIDAGSCLDETGAPTSFERSLNRRYFRDVMGSFGLADRAALIHDGGASTEGLSFTELLERVEDAALLINMSGHLTLEPVLRRVARTAYLDLDPGYTQTWHVEGLQELREHDLYFTVAENVGRPDCSLPTAGVRWLPARQPVVLDDWPVAPDGSASSYTTVGSWRSPFGTIEHAGRTMGAKAHQFRKLVALPEHVGAPFELALDIHPADDRDRRLLAQYGWRIVDPRVAAGDPYRFRDYVGHSAAEFSPAQEIYVETNSGWFSDRTVRYLAAGRPAVVQDTGFGRALPTGEGLLSFRDLQGAIAAVRAVESDPDRHRRAARALAEEMFDSTVVLARFLELAGVSA